MAVQNIIVEIKNTGTVEILVCVPESKLGIVDIPLYVLELPSNIRSTFTLFNSTIIACAAINFIAKSIDGGNYEIVHCSTQNSAHRHTFIFRPKS